MSTRSHLRMCVRMVVEKLLLNDDNGIFLCVYLLNEHAKTCLCLAERVNLIFTPLQTSVCCIVSIAWNLQMTINNVIHTH